jgi:hypothetical protein
MLAKKPVRATIAAVGAMLVLFGAWIVLFRPDDPKSLQYFLWKADLYEMNRGDMLRAFYSDGHRGDLVLGKSEEQLTKRFGRLASSDKMMGDLKAFAQNFRLKGHKVRFINGTAWMIVFDDDRAVSLLLVKG